MTSYTAPDIIRKLVETFEQNLDSYRSSKNETELRREFLDKFFTALGWDVANEKGYDELGKEVVHEFSVEVAGQQKKADYAFRVGRGEKFDFLVEAKKPSVKIETSQDAAFQIRRYGWSAKLPINILTDFEHFAVYDCRAKPNYSDKAGTGRILLMHYTEYAERWGELIEIFSPEAVRKGSFAKYAEGMKGKRGTADVDDAFLQEIERWRELLAKNIALRNETIDIAGLNYAVQMIIDRIVFLRICEERGIEPENQLLDIATPLVPPIFAERGKNSKTLNGENGGMSAGQGGGVYSDLCELFKRADTKYNSGLFHFKAEKGEPSRPDDLTLTLDIDDKVLKDILSNLYYPKSPYAFMYIPADILGQVYERFLGKVIRFTAGHQAKVEEKPEVRKAGGVYYTPTYIVDYIVKNTVGKLVENREKRAVTPADVAKLKIVDPACGSGTFLLGAYQFLLDWHLNWYVNDDAEKWEKQKAITPSVPSGHLPHFPVENGGGRVGVAYRLTTAKKKEILLNNIHGVDIDAQAVEVTKLSLLLKVLENASGQMGLGMERVLPDLGNNIKCGNSLIGFDYFEGQLLPDAEEQARVNPFDWEREFPQVFQRGAQTSEVSKTSEVSRRGGFDVVIGNPPYIRIQAMQEWASEQVGFYKQKYKAASKGNYDIYVVFIEKALSLLNAKGEMGFILPHKFFNAQYGEPVRELISQGKHISQIVHFGDQQIFDGATTYTCLLFLNKQSQDEFEVTKISDLEGWRSNQTSEVSGMINSASVNSDEWNFTVGKGTGLFEKLSQMPVKLGDVAEKIFQGLVTSSDSVYFLEPTEEEVSYQEFVKVKSKATDKEYELESKVVRPLIKGSRDISRYSASPSKRVVFPYDPEESAKAGKTVLIPKEVFKKKYPRTWNYLNENIETLRDREKGKMRHDAWYGYIYPKSVSLFGKPKLLTPSIAAQASFIFDANGEYYFVGSGGGGGGGYGIIVNESVEFRYEYLLGLLNSKLLDYFLKKISSPFQGGYFAFSKQYIEQLPIHAIDFTNPAEKAQHDKMVALVESMLGLHKSLAGAQSPAEKERLERQVKDTDQRIDALVYELYGLNEEEIKIVEGG